MRYELTDDLLTGNAMIDREHRQLITAINNMMEACASGQGRAKIASTVRFLRDYTERHFTHEENLQLRCGYPDYDAHKQLHDQYKQTVAAMERKLLEQGPTITLLGEVNISVAQWLVKHIRVCDKQMCEYVKAHSPGK